VFGAVASKALVMVFGIDVASLAISTLSALLACGVEVPVVTVEAGTDICSAGGNWAQDVVISIVATRAGGSAGTDASWRTDIRNRDREIACVEFSDFEAFGWYITLTICYRVDAVISTDLDDHS
jgi:hypothetical protein